MKHDESTIEKLKISFKRITYFHIQVLQCFFLEKKDSSIIWYIKKISEKLELLEMNFFYLYLL